MIKNLLISICTFFLMMPENITPVKVDTGIVKEISYLPDSPRKYSSSKVDKPGKKTSSAVRPLPSHGYGYPTPLNRPKQKGMYEPLKGLVIPGTDEVPAGITIPSGALKQRKMISVIALQEADIPPVHADLVNVTKGAKAYRFLPHGTKFAAYAIVHIPFDSTLVPEGYTADDIRTYYFDDITRQWVDLPLDTIMNDKGMVLSATTHFTDMINGIIKVPESPQTQGYTPTSIKDLQAVSPSSGIGFIDPPSANNMGSASLGFRFKLPAGRQGMQPSLGIQYSNEAGNGWLGLGWNLSVPDVSIDTRWGVPRYNDSLETETYILNGEQLAPIAHKGALVNRTAEKQFHPRVEGSFNKIIRHGNHPSNYWWEIINKNGVKNSYGGTASAGVINAAVLKDDDGNIAQWALVETRDLNNNFVHYLYQTVNDVGLPSGDVPGRQLYISDIYYTGNGFTEGAYHVEFIRDRQLGEAKRTDIDISARLGFKMVKADLLRKVNISFKAELIRSYELNYTQGAFYKTLLSSVSELDKDGVIFYTHSFEYYDDVNSQSAFNPFSGRTNWNIPFDNIHGDLINPLPDYSDEASALTSSKTTSISSSVAVTLGYYDGNNSKLGSVGGSFGSTSAKTEGMATMVDVNGDGLPDKVFKKDGSIYYRANLGGQLRSFGSATRLTGTGNFNRSKSKTTSRGLEADLYAFVIGIDKSKTINTTFEYFSDFNGDGLIDIANSGKVLFNRLDGNGNPTFIQGSTLTPSPIVTGGGLDPVFLAPDTALQAEQEREHPLHDVVRFWEAPFDGSVSITAPVQLLDVSEPGVVNPKLDGVRASIQLLDSVLWSVVIPAGDFTVKDAPGLIGITVQKGQKIYFRLQSVYNGDADVVKWDPVVQYNHTLIPAVDANHRPTTQYQASTDFLLSYKNAVPVFKDGTIQIDGNFSKGITSDTVEVIIALRKGNIIRNLVQRSYACSTVVINEPIIPPSFPVNDGDSLWFILRSDSYIDRSVLKWAPHLKYTSFTDLTPVTNSNGKPTIENYPVPDNTNYNDWLIKTGLLLNNDSDSVYIKPVIKGDSTMSGEVVFTVKGFNTIYGKIKMQLQNGKSITNDSIFLIRKPNDTIFCEYHTYDRKLALGLNYVRAAITPQPVTLLTVTDSLQAGLFTDPRREYLGTLFRGWGQFSYKGDVANKPIDESKLNINNLGHYSSDPNQYGDTSALNQVSDVANTDFIPLYSNNELFAWKGFDTSVYVTNMTMGSSRLWMHDVSVDSVMSGASLSAADRVSESRSTSYLLGLSAYGQGINATLSKTKTTSSLDMMDMNGDSYPDVLHGGSIQYTLPNGSLEKSRRSHNVGTATSESRSEGLSRSSFAPIASPNSINPISRYIARNAPAATGISAGTSGSVLNDNDDEVTTTWIDINGDRLPDKVYSNGNVSLNLGYQFAKAESWNMTTIEKSDAEQDNKGGNLGYSTDAGSFQGGYSMVRGENNTLVSFADVNGDGLPDRVRFNSNSILLVQLNTGNGFAPPVQWNRLNTIARNTSTGEALNVAFTVTIPITVVYVELKICINPAFSFNNGVARDHNAIMDIDGDGFADLLRSDNDGDLSVMRSRIGRTNMLRSVKRPMGGGFTIDYAHTGNTYALPQGMWVLKSVETADAVPGDGADTLRSFFSYSNGNYNRNERMFYGFASVTIQQLNTLAGNKVYRTKVQEYLNGDYYTKGLPVRQWLQDSAGKKYTQSNYVYELRKVQDSVKFPALLQTESLFYEGNASAGISTKTQMDYDALGNVIKINDAGDGSQQDMLMATVTYHDNNALYIKSTPASIEVNTVEGLKRKRTTSMDAKGNITQIRQYLADGSIAAYDFDYDNYGNLSKVMRPLNYKRQRMWYRYEYDNSVHSYITKVEDAFGYTSSSTYDYLFGTVTGTISMNNERMRYGFDNRGRGITVTGPYELAAGKPYTIAYEYYPSATVPYAITRHYDPEHNADINTITFSDAFDRPVQVKKQVSLFNGKNQPDSLAMVVSGKTMYDAFGRTIQTHYPVMENIGVNNTVLNNDIGLLQGSINYDVLDRQVKSILADGATDSFTYSIANGFFVTRQQDALQNVKEIIADVRQRTRRVSMLNGPNGPITTRFNYNALSEKIRVVDAGNNATVYTYDNLGRRTSIDHPDAGFVELTYDLAGNLLKKTTAQLRKEMPDGGAIRYEYDFERLSDVDYPRQYQNKVKYVYGKAGTGNRAGRLILQIDASGGQEFYYGKLGEVTKTIRTILISNVLYSTYVSEQEYDTWNRLKKMTYPDGEAVQYHYNKAGDLQSIDAQKLGLNYKYVNQLGYNEFQQRVYLQYGNGAETRYNYDSLRRRLNSLQANTSAGRAIMNNAYGYDAVNNILSIINNVRAVPGKAGGFASHHYNYDNLYRLKNARGVYMGATDTSLYDLSMEYDDLYNILSKKMNRNTKLRSYELKYTYGGTRPHQLTKLGVVDYKYDENGNLLTSGGRQNFWDEENRLMALIENGVVNKYTYDAGGERVIKSSGGIQGIWLNGAPAGLINHDSNYTAYVSPYLVCRRSSFTKHFYIEGQRIVSKIGIGRFQNISFPQSALTAGGINYIRRAADIQRQRYEYYASLGVSPGPPIDKYFYAQPYNSGIAPPIIVDSTSANVPPGWPGNTTPPPNGPPIFINPIPSNDSVKAGYGFIATNHFYEQSQFFYHPDHLGSTSYVTDASGEVSQHQEYAAYGETFFEEHVNSNRTPYLFNGKERDAETGLYYFGARYYDPRIVSWLSVDPLADHPNQEGMSPYSAFQSNPIKYTDPDGRCADCPELSYGFSIAYSQGRFTANVNVTVDQHIYEGFTASAGIGLTYYSNYLDLNRSGLEIRNSVMLGFDDGTTSASLGTNFWNGLGEMGEFTQRTGMLSYKYDQFSFRYENDGGPPIENLGLGDGNDSYRTAAASVGFGDYSMDLRLFTGLRDKESYATEGGPGLPTSDRFGATYKNNFVDEKGTPYRFGGLTLGYKGKNVGVNSEWIRHGFQNKLVHETLNPQPEFPMMSDDWKSIFDFQEYSKFTRWGQ